MSIAMMVFRAESELCDGCRMCELVCSLSKTGTVNPHLACIRVVRRGKGIKEDAPVPARSIRLRPASRPQRTPHRLLSGFRTSGPLWAVVRNPRRVA